MRAERVVAAAAIHPSAVLEPGATIGAGATIGPFCHVGPEAVIGEGVELVGHVTVIGATTIGAGTKVYPTAVLGGPPQSRGHSGGRTTLTIGRNCLIREAVTMHVGSDGGRSATTVGDNCQIFAYSHIAHDCIIGNNVTMTNNAALSGHCEIGDNVNIGGMTAIHQFVRVGQGAFLAGYSAIVGDVIPFGMAIGNRAHLRGFNIVGMRRSGMSRTEIHELRRAYRMLFDRSAPLTENVEVVAREFAASPKVMLIVDFIRNRGKRYYTVPLDGNEGDTGADDGN